MRLGFAVCLVVTACTPIRASVTETTVDRGPVVQSTTVLVPGRPMVQAVRCDEHLRVVARLAQTCVTSEVRRTAVERTIQRSSVAAPYEGLGAIVLVGGGLAASGQSCEDQGECHPSDSVVAAGRLTAVAGLGLGILAIADAVRARDSTQLRDSAESTTAARECGSVPARSRHVRASTPLGSSWEGVSDAEGVLRIPFRNLGPSAQAVATVDIALERFSPVSVLVEQGNSADCGTTQTLVK